jgi:hypothetical protein
LSPRPTCAAGGDDRLLAPASGQPISQAFLQDVPGTAEIIERVEAGVE